MNADQEEQMQDNLRVDINDHIMMVDLPEKRASRQEMILYLEVHKEVRLGEWGDLDIDSIIASILPILIIIFF